MKKFLIRFGSYCIVISLAIKVLCTYYYNKSSNILYKSEESIDFNRYEEYKNLKCRSIYLNYYIMKITRYIDVDYSKHSISPKNKKKYKTVPNIAFYYLKKFFRSLPDDYESCAKLKVPRKFYTYMSCSYTSTYSDPRLGYRKFTHNPWYNFHLFDKEGNPTENCDRLDYAKDQSHIEYHDPINLITMVFPKEIWLEKFMKITIGGVMRVLGDIVWNLELYIQKCLEGDKEKLEYFISILEKFTERETLAFWYGFWASIDIWNYREYYDGLMPKLPKKMKDLATEAALATGHGVIFDKLDDIETYFCQATEQGVLITENYMFIWDEEDKDLCDECKEKKELILSKVNNKS